MQLIPIALMLVFVIVMKQQQNKRVRAQQALLTSLEPGETVVTTSGIYGTIRSSDSETVSLEIADHVVIRVAKGAIARKSQGSSPEVPQ
jgi:preprotein translocase subunit YajC